MVVLLSLFAIVFGLLLVVGIHEVGHAIVARFFGVSISKVSIGFGPPLFCWQSKSGCRWIWALWPLGGYCTLQNSRIEPVSPENLPNSFDQKSVSVRCAILLAGIFMNLVLAWFLLVFMYCLGYQEFTPVIKTIETPSIASTAGFRAGDRIMSINGKIISSWKEVGMQFVMSLGKRNVSIVVENTSKKRKEIAMNLVSWRLEKKDQSLLQAMGMKPDLSAKQRVMIAGKSLSLSCSEAFFQLIDLAWFFLVIFKQLLIGILPISVLLGPLGFFSTLAHSFLQGLSVFLYFLASFNLAVAIFNVCPIPGLDGGSIVYALIEKIRGKPLSVAMEILLYRLIFIAFCLILVQLLLNDVQRFLH